MILPNKIKWSTLFISAILFFSCRAAAPIDEATAAAGLYPNGDAKPVTGVTTLDDALTWLAANAQQDGRYTVKLAADETLKPHTLRPDTLNGADGVEITLSGDGQERIITLGENGSLFTVETGNTRLILERGITLAGKSGNDASLLLINADGELEMRDGAKVINNKNDNLSTAIGANVSGGIYVYKGSFIMTGGEISGNEGSYGGGVGINLGQTFSMSDGVIQNNLARMGAGGIGLMDVLLKGSISGGAIIDNTAHDGTTNGSGGGIGISINGTLAISGGRISGNKALGTDDEGGGGIRIMAGIIEFSGGTIENNTTAATNPAGAGSDNLRIDPPTPVPTDFVNTTGQLITGSVPAR